MVCAERARRNDRCPVPRRDPEVECPHLALLPYRSAREGRQRIGYDTFAKPSTGARFLRILFSNGSRRDALLGFDALGCLRSLRARSALDGVSWVQGG